MEGVLKGKPIRPMKNVMLRTLTNMQSSYMWFTGCFLPIASSVATEALTDTGVGFSAFTIYRNTPLLPLRFLPDNVYDSMQITPSLPEGLSLDTNTGVLSGICRGSQASPEYTVTVKKGAHAVSSAIRLECKGRCC